MMWRKFKGWKHFHDDKMFKLLVLLISEANWETKNWKRETIKRGQLITSQEGLKNDLGWSRQTVAIKLKALEKAKEILIETNNSYTKITVLKYDKYQLGDVKKLDNGLDNGLDTTKELLITTLNIPEEQMFLKYCFEEICEKDNSKYRPKRDLALNKYHAWKESGWRKEKGGKMYPIKNWKTTIRNTWQYLK